MEVSRRDDIESLVYVLVEMGSGSLPWSEEQGHEDWFQHCYNIKKNTSFKNLTRGLPREFELLLQYVRSL